MELRVTGTILYWRGPAPHHFVPVPEAACRKLREVSAEVSYGWGVIPVTATLGSTHFSTSLFPKDGGYLVPVKAAVRHAEGLDVGDDVTIQLHVDGPRASW